MGLNQRRMLSTQIWEDDKFNALNANEKILYIGMITLGDDDGYFRADGMYLNAKVFPYTRMSVSHVKKMSKRLVEVGLIELFEIEKGIIGHHPNWTNHQQIRSDRYKASQFLSYLTTKVQPTDNQMTPQVNISKVNIKGAKEIESKQYSGSQKIIDNLPQGSSIKKQLDIKSFPTNINI